MAEVAKTQVFVLTNKNRNPGYDAPAPPDPDLSFLKMTAREAALGGLDLMLAMWERITLDPLKKLAWLTWYGDHCVRNGGRMARKVKSVDVDALVELWLETVVELSTAHSHAARTAADARTEELLGPILTAPIKQVRAFVGKLADRLEADERVPFLVWSCFRRITLPVVEDRPAGAAVRLRRQLAEDVAQLVDAELPREDLVVAIAGALQWRPAENLREVKTQLAGGAKPRIRGRESCLDSAVAVHQGLQSGVVFGWISEAVGADRLDDLRQIVQLRVAFPPGDRRQRHVAEFQAFAHVHPITCR